MVITNLNIKSVTIFKPETDAPLIINGYRMLPFTIIRKLMQLISRRYFKIIKTGGQIDILQFP